MDIIFSTDKLRKSLCNSRVRSRQFGALADVLGRRLDDLAAIEHLAQARSIPGQFEALTGDRAGQFSLRLSANWRLIFEAANNPVPQLEQGGIDLTRTTAVRILEVVDYHRR